MKKFYEKAEAYLYRKESGRWLLAVFLIIVLYGILSGFSAIRFDTNDDSTIVNSIIYAAEKPVTGLTSFMYINYFLGAFLAFFYRNFRNVPWYDLYSVAVLVLSGTVILKNVLREGYKNRKSFWKILLLILSLSIILFALIFQRIQFTTTAAAAGAAALVSYLCLEEKGKSRILDFVLIWLLFHMCMFQRETVGYVILAFFLLLVGIDVLKWIFRDKNFRQMRGRFLFSVLLLASLLLTTAYSEYLDSFSEEGEEFREYSDLRVRYMDYDVPSYQENPELYEKAGWDETLYIMVSNWYFMDERYNTDSLREILGAQGKDGEETGELSPAAEAGTTWLKLVRENREVPLKLLLLTVLAAAGFVLYFKQNRKKESVWSILVILGSVLGSALMYLYLCLKGRLPLRVFDTVMIPAVFLVVICVLRISAGQSADKKIQRWRTGISAVLAAVFLGVTCVMLTKIFDAEAEAQYQIENGRQVLLNEFASENQNDIYIYDTTLSIVGESIFSQTAGAQVDNLFFWGGTSMFSNGWYEKLEKNGLTELHSKDWFRDNVYFMTRSEDMIYVLNKYLGTLFDNVNFQVTDTVGDIFVVKFTN